MEKCSLSSRSLRASTYPTMQEFVDYYKQKYPELSVTKEVERANKGTPCNSKKLADAGFQYKYDMKQILDDSVTCMMRMMGDFKEKMMNNGMHEFYVVFHGPEDSCLLGVLYQNKLCLLKYRFGMFGCHQQTWSPIFAMTQLYGAIQGLSALGPSVVRLLILRNLETYLQLLEPEMLLEKQKNEMNRKEAWHVYGALLCAAGKCLYDMLTVFPGMLSPPARPVWRNSGKVATTMPSFEEFYPGVEDQFTDATTKFGDYIQDLIQ